MTNPTKYYAGIGSRQTPPAVLSFMTEIAQVLKKEGWTLRSGHAYGADRAFEQGAGSDSVIYLPWSTFGTRPYGNEDPGMPVLGKAVCDKGLWEKNFYEVLVANGFYIHPASQAITKLQGRNVAQVLGHTPSCPPSSFVLYWCLKDKDGRPTGGTRTAVNLASWKGIPSLNLLDTPLDIERITRQWIPKHHSPSTSSTESA